VLSDLGKYIRYLFNLKFSFKDDSEDLGSSIMQSANTNFNYSIDFIKH
jgi:hypothetical protein